MRASVRRTRDRLERAPLCEECSSINTVHNAIEDEVCNDKDPVGASRGMLARHGAGKGSWYSLAFAS